jgi:hypothetical protein
MTLSSTPSNPNHSPSLLSFETVKPIRAPHLKAARIFQPQFFFFFFFFKKQPFYFYLLFFLNLITYQKKFLTLINLQALNPKSQKFQNLTPSISNCRKISKAVLRPYFMVGWSSLPVNFEQLLLVASLNHLLS